jgi:acyl-CoA thioesterase I
MAKLSRRIAVCLIVPALTAATTCGGRALPAEPSQVPAPAAAIGRIVVLGDSLALSPTIAESFPARLQGLLDASSYRWTISNAGVWGDTTSDGLARFTAAVPAGTHVLVLELGANDGLHGLDIATMERNLAQIMERAREMRIQVLLCGMETPPFHGFDYTVRFHQVFARLAARYDLPLVPFLLSGVALNPDLNGADGIHPNAAGARRIAETVWPYLEPLVRAGTRTVARRTARSMTFPTS